MHSALAACTVDLSLQPVTKHVGFVFGRLPRAGYWTVFGSRCAIMQLLGALGEWRHPAERRAPSTCVHVCACACARVALAARALPAAPCLCAHVHVMCCVRRTWHWSIALLRCVAGASAWNVAVCSSRIVAASSCVPLCVADYFRGSLDAVRRHQNWARRSRSRHWTRLARTAWTKVPWACPTAPLAM